MPTPQVSASSFSLPFRVRLQLAVDGNPESWLNLATFSMSLSILFSSPDCRRRTEPSRSRDLVLVPKRFFSVNIDIFHKGASQRHLEIPLYETKRRKRAAASLSLIEVRDALFLSQTFYLPLLTLRIGSIKGNSGQTIHIEYRS
jgi:hypothetical protein